MPERTYAGSVPSMDKPLAWLRGEVKTPPFSQTGRVEAGFLLRRLQRGENLGLPHSRPLPAVGPRCHELRIRDPEHNWRLVYRIDPDAVVIAEVFDKKTQRLPHEVIEACKRRLRIYDQDAKGGRTR
jgi:phage-related protein